MTTGAIGRATAIHSTAALSSGANAWLNADTAGARADTDADTGSDTDTGCAGTNAWLDADTPGTHADTRSDTDTGCTGTNARNNAHTARAAIPDATRWCAVCIAVNPGFSR